MTGTTFEQGCDLDEPVVVQRQVATVQTGSKLGGSAVAVH